MADAQGADAQDADARAAGERELAERITALARAYAAEMTGLCAALVQTPSVNGRDPEAGVVALIARSAERYQLPLRRSEAAPGRPTLLVGPSVASSPIGVGGLLLVGHTDTVPEGDPTAWTYPPFAAQIAGGRLYGRGACDNKGGIAAGFFALVILARLGLLAETNATLLCVPDEEAGATGTLGISPLLEHGLLRSRGAIYTYPDMDKLQIGHRGLLRLALTAHGESIHTGVREWQERTRGANAVLAIADVLLELERLALDVPAPSPQGEAWAAWRDVVTPGTTIAGGTGQSIVPDRCTALIDVRLVEGQRPEAVRAQIARVIAAVAARRAGIRFELDTTAALPATSIPPDAAIVAALGGACEALLGTRPPLAIAGPANEGYLLNAGGIPTICGFGPIGAGAHAADEYVEVDSLPLAAALYALTAVRLRQMPQS